MLTVPFECKMKLPFRFGWAFQDKNKFRLTRENSKTKKKYSFAELKNNEIQHLENTSVNVKTAFQKWKRLLCKIWIF